MAHILAARKHRERMPALTGPPAPPPPFYPSSWDGTTHTQRRSQTLSSPPAGITVGDNHSHNYKRKTTKVQELQKREKEPPQSLIIPATEPFPSNLSTQTKQASEAAHVMVCRTLSRDGNGARCDLRSVLHLATLSSQTPRPAVSTSQHRAISWQSNVQCMGVGTANLHPQNETIRWV